MTLDPQPNVAVEAVGDRIRGTDPAPTPSGCIPEARWYVLIAKYGQHQLAERSLAADGWRTFFPLMVDRRAGRIVPLFASYAFIAIRSGDIGWPRIYSTRGVFTLLSRERRPLPLPVGAVESLQARTSDRRVVDDPLEHPEARIAVGATGTVVQGPWAGWDGVVALSRAKRLTLLLRLFGRTVPVDFRHDQVVAA
jgi:transcription antitermination factor NusG